MRFLIVGGGEVRVTGPAAFSVPVRLVAEPSELAALTFLRGLAVETVLSVR